MSAVLEARSLEKRYGADVAALQGVSITIEEGELLAIVGPSGSGKSTLLHVLGTLERPTAGALRIAGHEAEGLSDRSLAALRASAIGFVFQQFFLLDGRSALDNVADGLLYSGRPPASGGSGRTTRSSRSGSATGSPTGPNQLSGGEQQRVAVARAIVGAPRILFADEPTGNLDTASGEAVVELLRELNRTGTTVVVITHDRELAAGLPRRVELRDGRVELDTALAA